MRCVIVDLTRRRKAERRGGGAVHLSLDADPRAPAAGADDILRVREALDRLAAIDGRIDRVVEMRYFAGFTEAETRPNRISMGADDSGRSGGRFETKESRP